MWKHTRFLKVGLSHEAVGSKCQDAVLVQENENCIVAALADGLGSLKYSDVAAQTATGSIWELFASMPQEPVDLKDPDLRKEFAAQLMDYVAAKVRKKAAEMALETKEMDCTLVFVLISKRHGYAITGRLGDSAICLIRQNGSEVLCDSSASANGTSAVLDADARENMDIRQWDLDGEKILGFLLCSDGLDNEIYRKGSGYVSKAAEGYFNALVTTPDPQRVIARKVGALTEDPQSPFDDDISIAVLSRADQPIRFPEDPTWLCTCGARNRLQDTYCCQCGNDFSQLYQNVRFREHGGKAAFFQKINAQPAEERKLIAPQPAPVKPAEAAPAPAAAPTPAVTPAKPAAAPVIKSVEPTSSPVPPRPAPIPAKKAPPAPVENPAKPAAEPKAEDVEITLGAARPLQQPVRQPAAKASRQSSVPSWLPLVFIAGAAVVFFLLGLLVGSLTTRKALEKEIRELENIIEQFDAGEAMSDAEEELEPQPQAPEAMPAPMPTEGIEELPTEREEPEAEPEEECEEEREEFPDLELEFPEI